jgi:transcriptional regulator with XRE-family HTH domain
MAEPPIGAKLRTALEDKGWSYRRLIAEMRKVAGRQGKALPATASLIAMLSRWLNGHERPGLFYREILSGALGLDLTGSTTRAISRSTRRSLPPRRSPQLKPGRPTACVFLTSLTPNYCPLAPSLSPRAARSTRSPLCSPTARSPTMMRSTTPPPRPRGTPATVMPTAGRSGPRTHQTAGSRYHLRLWIGLPHESAAYLPA